MWPQARRASTHPFALAAALVALAGFGLLAVAAGPQSESGFLWIAQTNGLLNVATDEGAVRFELRQAAGFSGIAVNDVNGEVWAYGSKELRRFSRLGEPLLARVVEPSTIGDAPADLAVDGTSGNLWMAIKRDLYRFDLQGQLQQTIVLPQEAVGLSLDRAHSLLWVASARELHAYDAEGQRVVRVEVIAPPTVPALASARIRDVAWDPHHAAVWIAQVDRLARYDAAGRAVFQAAGDFAGAIATDGAGGLWLASGRVLTHVNADGGKEAVFEPFAGFADKLIVDLVGDPGDASAWIASSGLVRHFAVDGELLHEVSPVLGDGVIRRLSRAGLYVDADPPELKVESPSNGALLNVGRPDFELSWFDLGVGVDSASVAFKIGQATLTMSCLSSASGASCSPLRPLPEGESQIAATVADEVGNRSEPAFVRITVDTVPPAAPVSGLITIGEPHDGRATMTGAAGSVEPGSTVRVVNQRTGETVTVVAAADGSFSAEIAAEPEDELAISATDLAGNTGTAATARVPAPFAITLYEPLDGATVTADKALVAGAIKGMLNAGVAVNGAPATLLAEPGLLKFFQSVALQPGANTINVVAKLQNGMTLTKTVSVTRADLAFKVNYCQATGLAPRQCSFWFTGPTGSGRFRMEYDFDGNGTVDVTKTSFSSASYTYTVPGLYRPQIKLYKQNATTRVYELVQQHTLAVSVLDAAQLEQSQDMVLQSVWGGMKAALLAGDPQRALMAFTSQSRPTYGPVIEALLPHMPQIVSKWTHIEPMSLSDDLGEYLVIGGREDGPRVHVISFLKDPDGIWHIDSM